MSSYNIKFGILSKVGKYTLGEYSLFLSPRSILHSLIQAGEETSSA